jgi:hypothetical protein
MRIMFAGVEVAAKVLLACLATKLLTEICCLDETRQGAGLALACRPVGSPPIDRQRQRSIPSTDMTGYLARNRKFESTSLQRRVTSEPRGCWKQRRVRTVARTRTGAGDPRLGLKQLLMRVRASSLNYRDLMVLKTGGRGPTKIGVVPLSDGAGEVAATGEGVTRVKIGDRIAGCFHPRWFGGPIKPDYLTDRLGANLDSRLVAPGSRVTSEPDPTTVSRSAPFIRSEPCVCRRVRGWDLEFESGLLQR